VALLLLLLGFLVTQVGRLITHFLKTFGLLAVPLSQEPARCF